MLAARPVRISVTKVHSNTLLPILGLQVEAALARFPGLAPHLQIVLIREGPRNAMTAEVELALETPETPGDAAAGAQLDCGVQHRLKSMIRVTCIVVRRRAMCPTPKARRCG